jgi:hypothetical protein
MTIFRFKLLLAGACILSNCTGQSGKHSDRICTTPGPVTTEAAKNLGEQMVITDRCVHAWSYRLARAPGSNREVAEAALGGCRLAIVYEAGFLVREEGGKLTAQTEAEAIDRLRKRYSEAALFHVVQARAGHCKIP